MQRTNQGRGIVAMILFSVYPCATMVLPSQLLDDRMFSAAVAVGMVAAVVYIYKLCVGYKKPALIYVYGLYFLGLAMSLVSFGSVSNLHAAYPLLLLYHITSECAFVICCVQWGFLWYYAYSRRLISKETGQMLCKTYHPTLFTIMIVRRAYEFISLHNWTFGASDVGNSAEQEQYLVPAPMVPHAFVWVIISAFLVSFLLKVFVRIGRSYLYSYISAGKSEEAAWNEKEATISGDQAKPTEAS
mmetsp:Transcript_10488/g.28879  ORF Transcript_10488/g.28879 Transcript_10488/m.28879 type:complete len:244 (-) Transcript_10488:127-858(-)